MKPRQFRTRGIYQSQKSFFPPLKNEAKGGYATLHLIRAVNAYRLS